MPEGALLEVEDLRVRFATPEGDLRAVDGISYRLGRGEVLAIVGESGSGKTVHARALLRILDSPPADVSGAVRLEQVDLLGLSERELQEIRSKRVSMLFQDPQAALDPVFSVGDQLQELLKVRAGMSRREARRAAIGLLEQVGLPAPERRLGSYPHQLSGGIAQRVMMAMAIALDPLVLIADEPTSSLDVTVQAEILEALSRLIAERHMAVVLITHNLAVALSIADRVAVMYAGRIVEMASAEDLFASPRHPYTAALLRSIPSIDRRMGRLDEIEGSPPNLLRLPPGCAFHPRCRFAVDGCRTTRPDLMPVGVGHVAACLRVGEIRP